MDRSRRGCSCVAGARSTPAYATRHLVHPTTATLTVMVIAVFVVFAATAGSAGAVDVDSGISPSAPAAPAWTTSFYEPTVNQKFLKAQGCRTATQQLNTTANGVVILDFGVPRWNASAGVWGQLRPRCIRGHALDDECDSRRLKSLVAWLPQLLSSGLHETNLRCLGNEQRQIAVFAHHDEACRRGRDPCELRVPVLRLGEMRVLVRKVRL